MKSKRSSHPGQLGSKKASGVSLRLADLSAEALAKADNQQGRRRIMELRKYWVRQVFSVNPSMTVDMPILEPCSLGTAKQKLEKCRQLARAQEQETGCEISVRLLVENSAGVKEEIHEGA